MANVDYNNPFSMYQNVNPVPGNPFWSGWKGAENQMTAQPFMNQALESQGLELQKQRMDTAEYTGPEAQLQRSYRRKEDIEKAKQDIRAMPSMTDAKIAAANNARMVSEGTPYRDLMNDVGMLYPQLKDANPEQRAQMWQGMAQRWAQTHKGIQIPPEFQQYDDKHLTDAAAIHYAQLNTPEQVGKERLAGMEYDTQLLLGQQRAESAQAVASTQAQAHIRGAEIMTQTRETPDKAITRLKRTLATNPNDEDAQAELNSQLESKFNDSFSRDGLGNILQLNAASDPTKQSAYLVYREQRKARLFMDEGAYGPLEPAERSWILRAIAANPDAGVNNIIAEGRQRGKIKQRGTK